MVFALLYFANASTRMSPQQPSWGSEVEQDLARLEQAHLYRQRRVCRPLDAVRVERDGRELINFASNNYLGLTHHPHVLTAIRIANEIYGAGSGAAPLVSGYGPEHQAAEKRIAQWKKMQSAVLLPSGYQANHAAIQTAAAIGTLRGGVRFLVDKLAHASLIDAIQASGEPYRVFPHNHLGKLSRLLAEHPAEQLQVIVTESIFSMDGDAADLAAIAALKEQREFLLILDEAHASGAYGANGSGLADEMGLSAVVDVSVVTMSKALGGIGGAVCGSELFCRALMNYARAYLFSTSIPAATAAATIAAIDMIEHEPQRRLRLRAIALRVRAELQRLGFQGPAGNSPIIPLILGNEKAALSAAHKLDADGLLVVAIRPPTVPRGTSRLRITLCSEHTDQQIEQLLKSLADLKRQAGCD
jgi:8-amino-7-oxononanoate synthase